MPLIEAQLSEIPEPYRPGLVALASLSDESFDEFLSALQRAPLAANRKELSAWISPEVKTVPAPDTSRIIAMLTSLYRVRLRTEFSSDRVASDVSEAMLKFPDLGMTSQSVPIVASRLAKLLSLESLGVVETKAKELKQAYEHAFCDCRVFTDLRPVFGGNVADPPDSMLVVYTLKFGYHDAHEARHRDFYLALDAGDLASLKSAIERAEAKAKSLKSRLESASIKPLELA